MADFEKNWLPDLRRDRGSKLNQLIHLERSKKPLYQKSISEPTFLLNQTLQHIRYSIDIFCTYIYMHPDLICKHINTLLILARNQHTIILFSSRYLFPAKSICPTCTQAKQIVMQIRAAAPHPIETFVYFCLNLCCWAKNASGPTDHQDLHWTNVRTGTANRQQGLQRQNLASRISTQYKYLAGLSKSSVAQKAPRTQSPPSPQLLL